MMFAWVPTGFSNQNLGEHFASLWGRGMDQLGRGQMTYQLRRLPLDGITERIPESNRYRVTETGLCTAVFLTRNYARILRPAIAPAPPSVPCANNPLAYLLQQIRTGDPFMRQRCQTRRLRFLAGNVCPRR